MGGSDQNFIYGLCYQPSAGGNLTNFFGANFSLGAKSNQRQSWAAAATVVPGAGTWNVGFCVQNGSGSPINNNGRVNGWVMVVN